MRERQGLMAGLLIAFCVLLSACGAVSEDEESSGNVPAATATIEGSDVLRVTLTAKAAERVDIQTEPVRDAGKSGRVIPYAAVFYTADGDVWTYTSPELLSFVRAPIVIDHIDGDLVFLSDGPPPGTEVVTRGAAELFGTETGVEE